MTCMHDPIICGACCGDTRLLHDPGIGVRVCACSCVDVHAWAGSLGGGDDSAVALPGLCRPCFREISQGKLMNECCSLRRRCKKDGTHTGSKSNRKHKTADALVSEESCIQNLVLLPCATSAAAATMSNDDLILFLLCPKLACSSAYTFFDQHPRKTIIGNGIFAWRLDEALE